MQTSVEELEGNRVKLSVNLDDQEFEKALDAAFRRIAREVRIPGFRPGKAPRRILEARLGPEVARQEALREALPQFYAQALDETAVDAIAPPEIDITSGEESGSVAFDAVVEVRPKVDVPGYGSLRVVVPSPYVTEDEVNAQVERLRSQFGELEVVARPARSGDYVTIDIAGSLAGEPVEGLTADDYSYEVGSATVVPELDQHLRGAKVGDILMFDAAHPDPDEENVISLRVLVKEVKEKILPEVDDEWANEASEFETLAELRGDLRDRVSAIKRVQTQLSLREGVVSALTELVDDEAPAPLVQAELEHRVNDLVQRLAAQGATVEQYLAATDRSASDLTDELRTQAAAAVKADLALRAVIEAEGIELDDDELAAEVARIAERVGQDPERVRRELERAEQVQAVRSDLKKGKALEWLVEHAEVVDEEGAAIDRADLEPDQLPPGAATPIPDPGSVDPAPEIASPEARSTENEDQ